MDILIVEDDPDDAELTKAAFKRARLSNHVQVVRSGEEALDYVFGRGIYASKHPDTRVQMIFLDLKLPVMDGIEVLRRLKATPSTRNIPVVVLTGSQRDQDIEECNRLGATTCIVKPVDIERLVRITPKLCLDWALLAQTDRLVNTAPRAGD